MDGMLLPDMLARLWQDVEGGRLTREEFQQRQDGLLQEYRDQWSRALFPEGAGDLVGGILHELGAYFGSGDEEATRRLCLDAVARIKGEWCAPDCPA